LPDATIYELQRYRACDKGERLIYRRMRVLHAVGLMKSKKKWPPKTARSLLFVCFGNIMRSPMCEALMKSSLASIPIHDVTVISAGLNAVAGRTAHPWAIAAAREMGISLDDHRARPLSSDMVELADAIFVMDYQNLAQLVSRYPYAREKTFMISSYAGEGRSSAEISDPYYLGQEQTRECYRILRGCIQNLLDNISGQTDQT